MCWRPTGWRPGWSTRVTPEHLPGRPTTDRLDAVWLAKVAERGMLRPSFVPPPPIRRLRDPGPLPRRPGRHPHRGEAAGGAAARGRPDQAERGRQRQLRGPGPRHAGRADRRTARPKALAGLARGRLRGKHQARVEALTGRFDDHHAELARILLAQIDTLGGQIDQLTSRIEELIGAIPAAQAPGNGADPTGGGGDGAAAGSDTHQPSARIPLSALARLDEVPGIGNKAAQVIIAELGLDMGQFPTAAHLVSWARLAPRTSSPAPSAARAPPATATPTSRAYSARSPPRPPRPTPPSARATAAWSGASASSRPWPPSPAASWSSSGTCCPTPPPASTTSAPTTTPAASTTTARPATT